VAGTDKIHKYGLDYRILSLIDRIKFVQVGWGKWLLYSFGSNELGMCIFADKIQTQSVKGKIRTDLSMLKFYLWLGKIIFQIEFF